MPVNMMTLFMDYSTWKKVFQANSSALLLYIASQSAGAYVYIYYIFS